MVHSFHHDHGHCRSPFILFKCFSWPYSCAHTCDLHLTKSGDFLFHYFTQTLHIYRGIFVLSLCVCACSNFWRKLQHWTKKKCSKNNTSDDKNGSKQRTVVFCIWNLQRLFACWYVLLRRMLATICNFCYAPWLKWFATFAYYYTLKNKVPTKNVKNNNNSATNQYCFRRNVFYVCMPMSFRVCNNAITTGNRKESHTRSQEFALFTTAHSIFIYFLLAQFSACLF